jgi:hypothetical protein
MKAEGTCVDIWKKDSKSKEDNECACPDMERENESGVGAEHRQRKACRPRPCLTMSEQSSS